MYTSLSLNCYLEEGLPPLHLGKHSPTHSTASTKIHNTQMYIYINIYRYEYRYIPLNWYLEEGLPPQHFRKYAAHGPQVDRLAVVARVAQQFGGPVPARDHVLGQLCVCV